MPAHGATRRHIPRRHVLHLLGLAALGTTAGTGHAAQGPAPLRVLSYNIKRGLGMDEVTDITRAAAVINRLTPDVVALQEIDVGVERSGRIDQAKELARLTNMTGFFAEFMPYQGGQYGQMVLSKLPVIESRRIALPDGQEEPRASAVMRVRAPFGELTIACVHFYRTEADRLAQAKTLIAELATRPEPVLLVGDFNSRRGSVVMNLVEQTYANPAKHGQPNTIPASAPRAEIDFITYRPASAFTVTDYQVIAEPVVSDHLPVVMVLQPAAR